MKKSEAVGLGIIILILHGTFGIAAFLLGKLVFVDSAYASLYTGLGSALLVAGAGQGAVILYHKTRKLTDKDRVKKIGAIEKKAEIQAISRAKAGYQTLKISAYLLMLAIFVLIFSGIHLDNVSLLDILLGIAFGNLAIFGISYLLTALKESKK